MHEEDYGILWKHVDMMSGRTEVRRSRRLVVSSIATVGNYEYGFYWYFYLDGTMQLEVKLTGIMSTMAVDGDDPGEHARMVAPGLAAPLHQHLFNVRLDVEVDGADNAVFEVDAVPCAAGDGESRGERVRDRRHAARDRAGGPSRRGSRAPPHLAHRQPQPAQRRGPADGLQALARRRHRRCSPTPSRASAGAPPSPPTTCGSRPFDPDERRAAGDYPNQHAGGAGLPAWTAQDRSVVDTDIVLWHSFGVTHVPRPEDWPVMPVEYTGFTLMPFGFFDRNPALDVPPAAEHCDD